VEFDRSDAKVAVFWGAGGTFCAGWDLQYASTLIEPARFQKEIVDDLAFPLGSAQPPRGPLGPSCMELSKHMVAGVEGAAVAGGMELALLCDVRVMAETAYLGVYCRRWGITLLDGGTVRLPRLVGQGKVLEITMTGRKVPAEECYRIGLCEKVVAPGTAREAAEAMAHEIARFPQQAVLADRRSIIETRGLPVREALKLEWANGVAAVINEGVAGEGRFRDGTGRHGDFSRIGTLVSQRRASLKGPWIEQEAVPMPDYSFTERMPLEAGFAAVFARDIVPILDHHEKRRRETRKQTLSGIGIAGVRGAGGRAVSSTQGWDDGVVLLPVLGVFGIISVYGYFANKWRQGLAAEVLPVMCNFLGGISYGAASPQPETIAELGLVPRFSRAEIDDTISGSHGGLDYVLIEVKLKRRSYSSKGRRRTRTVFRGLLIRIELLEEVPSILFARDYGGVGNCLSKSLSSTRQDRGRIEAPFPEFEARYETYTDDPEGARNFITPELTDGLLAIARAETDRERYLAAATEGHGFYLVLPRKGDFLSLGSLFRPLADSEKQFHQALADLTLPRWVIDTLRGS